MGDNRRGLVVVASGNATRFGGCAKAFCFIGKEMNIGRTIRFLSRFTDSVYVIVKQTDYLKYKDQTERCELVPIETGQGDAHSLLKGLRRLKADGILPQEILVCWGDAVFLSDRPVKDLLRAAALAEETSAGVSVCALDASPYAWFGLDGKYISKSYFASQDGDTAQGIHDQSLFYFKTHVLMELLEAFWYERRFNEKDRDQPYGEMKLLKAFEYFYQKGKPVEYTLTKSGGVMSFNTEAELLQIEELIQIKELVQIQEKLRYHADQEENVQTKRRYPVV